MSRQSKPTYSQTPGVRPLPTNRTEQTQSFGESPKVPGQFLSTAKATKTATNAPAVPGGGTGGSGTSTAYASVTLSAASGLLINGQASDTRGGASPMFALSFLVTAALLKGNTLGGLVAAVAGTDYSLPVAVDGVNSVGNPISFAAVSRLSVTGSGGYFAADGGDGHPILTLLGGAGGGSMGTVTSVGVSVFPGIAVTPATITNAGTFVFSTTLSGVLKGTGSGFAVATPGTDYGLGSVTSVSGSGGSTGLTLGGGPITGVGTLALGGTLALANGGTGATTAAAARNNLGLGTAATTAASDYEPSLGNPATSGYVLSSTTSGVRSWIAPPSGGASGTVTSVSLTAPTGFSVSGSPITGSGTLALSTTLSGLIKGNGSGFVAATAGTDYEGALGNPGTNGFVLSSTSAGVRSWVAQSSGGMTNPMTTADDIIKGGAAGAPTRVAKGANNTVWGVDNTGVLGYKADPTGASTQILLQPARTLGTGEAIAASDCVILISEDKTLPGAAVTGTYYVFKNLVGTALVITVAGGTTIKPLNSNVAGSTITIAANGQASITKFSAGAWIQITA